MTMFRLGSRSKRRLSGIHPDLKAVVELAIEMSMIDFTVLEGARTHERQLELFAAGATSTMNSRHIIKAEEDGGTGFAHAVDLGAWVAGEVRWDWPLYHQIANAMKLAAVELGIKIEWGGDWRSFKDGPHFQLSWTEYPA
jgi:peptidoglycan L-alanyl-D-glutamate endopeptidase CwlK